MTGKTRRIQRIRKKKEKETATKNYEPKHHSMWFEFSMWNEARYACLKYIKDGKHHIFIYIYEKYKFWSQTVIKCTIVRRWVVEKSARWKFQNIEQALKK